jgi:phospholipase C
LYPRSRTTYARADAYTSPAPAHVLAPGKTFTWHWPLEASFGWYELTIHVESDPGFEPRLAAHVETGKDSIRDPALGV